MSALVDRTVWSAAYDTTLSVSGVQNVYAPEGFVDGRIVRYFVDIDDLSHQIAVICDAPEPVVVRKFRDSYVRAAQCEIETAAEVECRPSWPLEKGLPALLQRIGDAP